ncbi:MAG: GNAT family protein [Pyrinomonadaceae bacterium]
MTLKIEIENGLELRLFDLQYAEILTNKVLSNHNHLKDWLPWATKSYSVDSATNFVRFSLAAFAKGEAIPMWVFSGEDLIGSVGFNRIESETGLGEIGYWLASDFEGRGIVTKGCSKLIAYAFENTHLRKAVIRCAADNLKSRAVPTRLGFTEESLVLDGEWIHDKSVDLVIYSLSREEHFLRGNR